MNLLQVVSCQAFKIRREYLPVALTTASVLSSLLKTQQEQPLPQVTCGLYIAILDYAHAGVRHLSSRDFTTELMWDCFINNTKGCRNCHECNKLFSTFGEKSTLSLWHPLCLHFSTMFSRLIYSTATAALRPPSESHQFFVERLWKAQGHIASFRISLPEVGDRTLPLPTAATEEIL